MKKLLIATALLAASATANAAIYEVTLTSHLIGRAGNVPSSSLINPGPNFAGDTGNIPLPTFLYDDVTGALTSTGMLHLRSQTGPSIFSRVFDRYITDLNIVGGSAAGTTAYNCENFPEAGSPNQGSSPAGGFGALVGANICGNYTLGGNAADDSTLVYGPGLLVSRVMGGDDVISGPAQSIADYDLIVASFDPNGNLVLQSSDWNATSSQGLQMTFEVGAVIPVPAAVWLFGSALGLLGLARRRLAA